MNKSEIQKRIEKLKKVINYHRYLYHVRNKQEISQEALDSLKHELYKLEQRYPEFITSDSPTQRVAGKPLDEFKKKRHRIAMLSIEDVFEQKELKNWENYLKKLISGQKFQYFAEMKIDGFAISLIYKNGIFSQGATRGDGITGEDVTQNLKTIESIPLKLEIHQKIPFLKNKKNLKKLIEKDRIEIRGEVYMEKRDFEKFNEKRKKEGKSTYSNPRNLAAGSIRQLNPKLASERPLKFLAYDLIANLGQGFHSQGHQILSALGFKIDLGRVCQNLAQALDFWQALAKKREVLPFQIDGVVVSVDNNSLFQKLGVAGKSPRGIRALKFSPKQATTKIKDIKVQMGRTGALTPVAHLEPVKVEGVTITRATLHNHDQLKRLGVKIGDTIIIERAGDVIPAVVKVLKELRTGREKGFQFPTKCPICKSKLVRPLGEAVWRCPNPDCSARRKEILSHFVSKKAFDIVGVGPKIIDLLMDENLISRASDIFELKQGDLIPLERFAEKSARNLVRAIENSRKISLTRFIYSFGIRYVGEETAIALAQYFGSIEKLKDASKEELKKIPDIGPQASQSIFKWFKSERNLKLIEDLKKAGVKILAPQKFGKKLKRKTFVLTGTLKSMSRAQAENKIRILGGHPTNLVSKKTDFLIVGKNPGSKLEEAKKLGIRILNEKNFLQLLQ